MARKRNTSDQRRVVSPVQANEPAAGTIVDDARLRMYEAEEQAAAKVEARENAILESGRQQLINLKGSGAAKKLILAFTKEQNVLEEKKTQRDIQGLARAEKLSKEQTKVTAEKTRQEAIDKKALAVKERKAAIDKRIAVSKSEATSEMSLQSKMEKEQAKRLGVAENRSSQIQDLSRLKTIEDKEQAKILEGTIRDKDITYRLSMDLAKSTAEIFGLQKQMLPHEDKILALQKERGELQKISVKNLNEEQATRIKDIGILEKEYVVLQKKELLNKRLVKLQDQAKDLVYEQDNAFSKVMSTLKSIITNPLVIFTGLLALGVARYEEMRQRGNQLAEEMDRVNKGLAGAGPYQDKIIAKARIIRSEFNAAGEGFSSSMENAVAAVQALEKQMGNVDFVSAKLVKTMSKLKLSIGLSDDESAKVLDNFMIMGGLSEDAAINATKLTYQMSETVGLNPADVFRDIASASGETLAHFTGGAHQIAKAAVEARRMGLTLQDVAKISSSLLDFETSIEAEMEAQMLTGMDLNFNKARMFAMNKQGDKAAEEVMRQVGGLQRFQKMNIFQQEAIAKATGLDLNTLLKSNVQREREAKLQRDKNKLVGSQLEMSVEVTKMMGKLDAGLGIMQQIGVVLGDIFLDVFMPSMKAGEKTFMTFIKGDKFKTVVTSILKGIKWVMDGIVGIFEWIGNSTVFKAASNWFGGGNLSASNPGSMDKDKSANRIKGAVVAAFSVWGITKLGSWLLPMWVKVKGGVGGLLGGKGGTGGGGLLSGIKHMLGFGPKAAGPLTKAGLPDMRYAANRGLGGAGAVGNKFLGMNLGSAMGGTASAGTMGLGGTALGGAGVALGAAGVIGSVGMGIYDVATLGDRATRRDKATAWGGLGGAVGGAATGALIGSAVPVIGTLLGAGIGGILGYFGGRSVGAMDVFRDDLDKARDFAQDASENRAAAMSAAQHRYELDAMKGSMQVGKAFRSLSGGLKELTGDKMKEFGRLLVDQGQIGKEAFAQFAADGKITMTELQQIQQSVSANILAMGNESLNAIITTIDETGEYAELPSLQKQLEILTKMVQGDMSGRAQSQLGLKEFVAETDNWGRVIKDTSGGEASKDEDGEYPDRGWYMTRANITAEELEKVIIAQTGITDLTQQELIATFNAYQEATGYNLEENQFNFGTKQELQSGLVAAMNVLADSREKQFMNLSGQRDNEIADAVTGDLNNNGSGVLLNPETVDDIVDGIDGTGEIINNLIIIPEDQIFDINDWEKYNFPADQDNLGGLGFGAARGGITGNLPELAGGGVLYGPSHAGGGIPTKYGELEGGEAVINKKSTAMHAPLLSMINQSGGGASFADGGITNKFAGGGLLEGASRLYGYITPHIAEHAVAGSGLFGLNVAAHATSNIDEEDQVAKMIKYADIAGVIMEGAAIGGQYAAASSWGASGAIGSWAGGGAVAGVVGTIGAALGVAALFGWMAYQNWYNSFHKSQTELANYGGLTEKESSSLFKDISNLETTPTLGAIRGLAGYGGYGYSTGDNAVYDEFYKKNIKSIGKERLGNEAPYMHWTEGSGESLEAAQERYKYGRDPMSGKMFWPEILAYIKANMGHSNRYTPEEDKVYKTKDLDVKADVVNYDQAHNNQFKSHGTKNRGKFVQALAGLTGGIKGYVDPMNSTRHNAVMAPNHVPGALYTDPYGYGPIPGAAGYRLRNTTGTEDYTYGPDQELFDVLGLKARKKGGDKNKYYQISEQSGGDLANLVENIGHDDDNRKGGWSAKLADYLTYHSQGVPGVSFRGTGGSHSKSAQYYQGTGTEYDDDRVWGDFNKFNPKTWKKQKETPVHKTSNIKVPIGTVPMADSDMYGFGGVIPTSPLTKVNDMILTKDGQMIETHADDNIIAKKGGITQTPAGGAGGTRIEKLLEGILMATQEGHIITIDGARVSSAINSANHDI